MKTQLKFIALAVTGSLSIGAAPVLAQSTTADVPALTPGIAAPTLDVGTTSVTKGTVQYSNSVGSRRIQCWRQH